MLRSKKPVDQRVFGLSDKCPLQVSWGGGVSTQPYILAYHPEIEFHVIKEGRGAYLIQGHNYPFRANALLVIRPNEVHNFIPDPSSFVRKGKILFLLSFLGKNLLTRFPSDFPHCLTITEHETTVIEMIINWLHDEIEQKDIYWSKFVRLKLTEFILLVKRISRRGEPPQHANPIAVQVADYLEQHFSEPINIPFLTKMFGYSESHLSHLFKNHTGLGLKHYLLQRRIIEAKEFINQEPSLKVTAVAEKVGFKNFGLFNRSFKLLTGLTPTDYRRNSHLDCRK